MNLPKDKALIDIVALVHDDADDFMGADIENFDRDTGIASLKVDVDDIKLVAVTRQEICTTEAWGQVVVHREPWIEVTSCKWNDYPIINYQEIADRLSYEN